jgi:hypothetical protein
MARRVPKCLTEGNDQRPCNIRVTFRPNNRRLSCCEGEGATDHDCRT